MIKIKAKFRKNLNKLADYLAKKRSKNDFDINVFCDENTSIYSTTCGTVGCAIGHGPYAGIKKLKNEDWFEYSVRVFGFSSFSQEWMWCFDSGWSNTDNTPTGAAKRIRYLLQRGLPEDAGYQRCGTAPLSYTKVRKS